jgi:hypothetical protein
MCCFAFFRSAANWCYSAWQLAGIQFRSFILPLEVQFNLLSSGMGIMAGHSHWAIQHIVDAFTLLQ